MDDCVSVIVTVMMMMMMMIPVQPADPIPLYGSL